MKKKLLAWCALSLGSGVSACSGSESLEEEQVLDAGQDAHVDGAAQPEDAGDGDAQDAETGMDAAPPEDAGPDATSSGEEDAGLDASDGLDANDASDASDGSDASDDAGTDGGAPRNVIYASFNGVLVRIDPDTAELTEIGEVRNAVDTNETFSDLVLTSTRDGNNRTAWMVTSYYQSPTLAKLDLCSGLATLGPALARTNPNNLVVEGLAVHENGTVYVTSGNPGNPVQSPLTNHLGTLNVTTGAITDLSATTISSYQNDGDMLFFRGDTLYGVDVATPNNLLDLRSFDLTTGAASRVLNPYPNYGSSSAVPLRIAHDETRKKTFAWRDSDNYLLEFDMATGAVTPIGQTHPDGVYGNQPSRGFFVAPPAECDD